MRVSHKGLTITLVVGALASLPACAARTSDMATTARPATPSYAEMVARADSSRRSGRTDEALALLAAAGDAAAPVEVRRDALFAHGLLRLDPASPHHDPDAAAGLLAAAHALHDDPPSTLVTSLHVADHLRAQRTALAALQRAHDALAARAAASDEQRRAIEAETRRLQQTVRDLRSDLQQRDAALKKAADAVIGAPRSR